MPNSFSACFSHSFYLFSSYQKLLLAATSDLHNGTVAGVRVLVGAKAAHVIAGLKLVAVGIAAGHASGRVVACVLIRRPV